VTEQSTNPAPKDTEQPKDQTIEHVGVEPTEETPAADEGVQNDEAVQEAESAGDQ
jgi:hypothetical protein